MIGELTIRNFKCFKDVKLPLKPITVISGGNGVGKSSMIQSLLLLRQAADQLRVLDDLGALTAGTAADFPVRLNGPYRLALGNTLTLTNAELESNKIEIGVQSSDTPEQSVSVTFIVDTVASVTVTGHHAGSSSSAMLNRGGTLPVFSGEFHYLIAERNGPRDLGEVSDENFINTGMAGEHTADAIARAENLPVHEHLCIVEGSDLFKIQLEGWMRLLVPNVRLITQSYPEINRVRLSIEKAGSPVAPLSPTNTGFGISYVLPIVVSGLLAPAGSMLIVENPEAHLHPAAQSAVGQFLATVASAGVQVVVETHSENVINGVRLAAIHGGIDHSNIGLFFFSSEDGNTQPQINNISVDALAELSAWPIGFFDQQGRDLTELMKARRAKRSNPE
ncbi:MULTISPECIES: DUF3696 domain-containing protein [Pseudomonas]|uniref:DUF3696 domain-containing protein n=1 Tax=Pseudomonas quercus TaxID=2722792 RepID=A0ABX0YHW4_9PSED|nr:MULTISPECIES: DUF3696 domain-containing protein [Pseudomonas]MBF7144507.1 DUF3696 domain-containing protein [Pseudomonas sp. LY10J]NJP03046.1 DUF3696 domain-containing protein [Pseudomonas quercus]